MSFICIEEMEKDMIERICERIKETYDIKKYAIVSKDEMVTFNFANDWELKIPVKTMKDTILRFTVVGQTDFNLVVEAVCIMIEDSWIDQIRRDE